MRIFKIIGITLFSIASSFAQDKTPSKDTLNVKIDSLYREDQFYLGFTYNRLVSIPTSFDQQRFSAGISLGFLRDMPINKRRNVAIATGLGFTYNNYFQNLTITNLQDGITYFVINNDDFDRNKFSNLLVDVPIEFRWRTSTPTTYKFWRVYSGVKLSYLLSDVSVLKNDGGKFKVKNNHDFNKFQYGLYLSLGYNTWNFYGYYGLNSLFKSGVKTSDTAEDISIQALNFGLIFYMF